MQGYLLICNIFKIEREKQSDTTQAKHTHTHARTHTHTHTPWHTHTLAHWHTHNTPWQPLATHTKMFSVQKKNHLNRSHTSQCTEKRRFSPSLWSPSSKACNKSPNNLVQCSRCCGAVSWLPPWWKMLIELSKSPISVQLWFNYMLRSAIRHRSFFLSFFLSFSFFFCLLQTIK